MIHIYRNNDQNILLDVESGSVHTVSDTVSDILFCFVDFSDAAHASNERNGNVTEVDIWSDCKPHVYDKLSHKHALDDLTAAVAEIDDLADEGLIFAPQDTESIASPELTTPVIKAMCLNVAHDCNMRCVYCFADEGSFGEEKSMMSLETGKQAIDFLIGVSAGRKTLEIDFFGGEPLLNFDVVKSIVAYGRDCERETGKRIRFTITTNGLLLNDEITDFLNAEMDNVILSLDGRPEVNDRMRKTKSGLGTADAVTANIERFVSARKALDPPGQCYVRGTFTKFNKDFTEDAEYLVDRGFTQISLEPVVASSDCEYAISEEDIPEILDEYGKLEDFIKEHEAAGTPITFFHYNVDLSQGPCVYKRAAGCGAGTSYVAVSPSGDIYPCHQFVGESEYKIGNVNDYAQSGSFDNKLFEQFNKAHIFSKDACHMCWAKYYCSGGCHANAVHISGDIDEPYAIGCILERKRLECAIGLAAGRASDAVDA